MPDPKRNAAIYYLEDGFKAGSVKPESWDSHWD